MATIVIQHVRFDVVEYIRKLRSANFTQEQAELLAQETEQVISSVVEQTQHVVDSKELVTKKDLELTKIELQKEMQQIKLEMQQIKLDMQKDVNSSKLQTIIWMGIFFVTNGILAHFLK